MGPPPAARTPLSGKRRRGPREGAVLPPLRLTEAEAEAALLGLRLVAGRGEEEMAAAAEEVFARLAAILPPATGAPAAEGPFPAGPAEAPHLPLLHAALQAERKLRLRYVDKKGVGSGRVVWPIAIGFFAEAEVLAAWCELRDDFRHFRLDRIAAAELLPERMPQRRQALLAKWRAAAMDADGM